MSFAESAIRGGAIALLLTLIALTLPNARRSPGSRYGALFALCGIAYLLDSEPALAGVRVPWLVPAQILSVISPTVFWLWAAAYFDDGFAPAWRNWLPGLGLLALDGVALTVDRPVLWLGLQIVQLLPVGLGLWLILASGAGDLVEARRRLRLVLSTATALTMGGISIVEFAAHGRPGPGGSAIVAGGLALLAFCFVLLRARGETEAAVEPASLAAASVPTAAFARVSEPLPEEAALLARLTRLMQHDRVYREEGLSVATLANRLGTQEYRLRRLINQRLGHRNFTSFVNGYRLADTVTALADPEQARVPVLTIALDAGFQSIGPFNRAFKAHTGMTPSEYRREHLAAAAGRAAE